MQKIFSVDYFAEKLGFYDLALLFKFLVPYIKLLKPRIALLVVFTAFTGIMIAPGKHDLFVSFLTLFSIALASCGAAAFNMWYDHDIDALMSRTVDRSIPSGAVSRSSAFEIGLFCSLISFIIASLGVNFLVAGLLVISIVYYSFFYTVILKRSTPQNIVIGGLAGSFPPLMGYASVTGNIGWESIVLAVIVFLWTPPHFWSLAIFLEEDYASASVPMMPNVVGRKKTALYIFFYTICLSAAVVLPIRFINNPLLYLFISSVLSSIFLIKSLQLLCDPSIRKARSVFFYSLFYLFAVFFAIILCCFV